MLCYRDCTFCEYADCASWDDCPRALTQSILDAAREWWPDGEPPICTYTEKPYCYKEARK